MRVRRYVKVRPHRTRRAAPRCAKHVRAERRTWCGRRTAQLRALANIREHDPTDGGILTNIFEVCSPLRAQCGRAFAQLLLRVVSARTVTTCV